MGWPPIRSFRKNIGSGSSSKLPTGPQQHQNVVPDNVDSLKPTQNCGKGLFVKINMDGVPIGRKLNINAYNSYEKLFSAVDDLFRGLLAGITLENCVSGVSLIIFVVDTIILNTEICFYENGSNSSSLLAAYFLTNQ